MKPFGTRNRIFTLIDWSGGCYTLALSGVGATGYTATATAAGAQTSDARCTSLSIVVAGGNTTYGATGTGTANQCWNR